MYCDSQFEGIQSNMWESHGSRNRKQMVMGIHSQEAERQMLVLTSFQPRTSGHGMVPLILKVAFPTLYNPIQTMVCS